MVMSTTFRFTITAGETVYLRGRSDASSGCDFYGDEVGVTGGLSDPDHNSYMWFKRIK